MAPACALSAPVARFRIPATWARTIAPWRIKETGTRNAYLGSTTRMIGALVMTHADDNGLRVPPRLARIQAVVPAIKDDEAVPAKVRELGARLTRPAADVVAVRCLVAEARSVPDAERAPGNVAVAARA